MAPELALEDAILGLEAVLSQQTALSCQQAASVTMCVHAARQGSLLLASWWGTPEEGTF